MNPHKDILRGMRVRSGTLKTSGHCENVRLTAEELTNLELLIDTTRPLTFVEPQSDCENRVEKLQVYAPMWTALIDPPYELAPYKPVVVALQSELFTPLMDTLTPLAVVDPEWLLLPPLLELQAYPPKYNENDPP